MIASALDHSVKAHFFEDRVQDLGDRLGDEVADDDYEQESDELGQERATEANASPSPFLKSFMGILLLR